MIRWLASALALISLSACGCNLVGCRSGVTVQLSAPVAYPYSVEIFPADGGAPSRTDCTNGSVCLPQEVFVTGVSATNVTVRVSSPSSIRDTDVAGIRYTTSYPNGKGCSPACRYTTIQANAP